MRDRTWLVPWLPAALRAFVASTARQKAALVAIGLPASAVVAGVQGAPVFVGADNALGLVLLAVIPGLLALRLYYLGLQTTPASRATLAELAFPATAAYFAPYSAGRALSLIPPSTATNVRFTPVLHGHDAVEREPRARDE